MSKTRQFWDEEIETMPRKQLERMQLERLKGQVERAYSTSTFYRELYQKAGVRPEDIKSLEDARKLPFVDKTSAQDAYPFGMLVCELGKIRELHSATTPSRQFLPVYATKKDLSDWAERCARVLWMVGLRPGDSIQNSFRFGLSTGGFGFHYGAMKAGMMSIPASTGGTDRQIDLIVDLGVKAVAMMPSYGFYLAMRAHERGIDLARDGDLKVGLFGAEPTSPQMKDRLGELMGLTAYGEYGMNEFLGPGMACHCLYKKGMHTWADHFLVECVDPDSGEVVPEGIPGELVWTWLSAEGTAMIRYRSHDISSVTWERCPCKRTHPRITRISGRTDGALSIGGYIVYPSKLQDVMGLFPEVGDFHVILDSVKGLDCMTIRAQLRGGTGLDAERLALRICSAIRSYVVVTPRVEVVPAGTLGTEVGKSGFRIIDYRRGSGRYGVRTE